MAMAAFFCMLQCGHESDEELHTGHKKIKRNIKTKSLEHKTLNIITHTHTASSFHELISIHSLYEKYLIKQTAVVHSGM